MLFRRIELAGLLLVATAALAAEPAQLKTTDPLTLPAPVLLEPMRFAPDSRTAVEKIQPMLWAEALERGADAVLPIIVTLREPLLAEPLLGATPEADSFRVLWVASLAHQFASEARTIGLADIRALSHFPVVFGNVLAKDLPRIAGLSAVRAIQPNMQVEASRVQGGALMNSPTLRNSLGGTGAGIGVAVIDSGVDDTHVELSSRVTVQADYTGTTGDGTIDGTSHGTSCAGIIAGTAGGMAPQAEIWALKVFKNDGTTGPEDTVLLALNDAYANRNNFGGLNLINMSLGTPEFQSASNCDALFPADSTVVNQLVAAGIAIFASSGNEESLTGVSFPACLQHAISVGAVSDAPGVVDVGCSFTGPTVTYPQADQILCYSNSGPPLDILAPSACSVTTRSSLQGGGTTSCFNGTSAASPYAAGVAAQILSLRPTTTPAQLRTALMTTGRPITDVNGITRTRIDAVQAYQALAGSGGGPCIPGQNTACLLSGRFKVEVQWTDFSAVTRNAFVASAGTSDTALFYWTNPNNWELLIKGVNACSFNNKFWIYFAAATNVGYRVTVTDTQTSAAPKVYTNAVGNLAQATNDISAFNCP